MASVVLMLDNYTVNLPPPAEPAFFFSSETESAIEVDPTINKVIISDLEPGRELAIHILLHFRLSFDYTCFSTFCFIVDCII